MIMASPKKAGCFKQPYIRFIGIAAEITTEQASPKLKRSKTEGPEIQKIQTKYRMAQFDQSKLEERGGELNGIHFSGLIRFEYLDPDKEFYLLPPYSDYYYCQRNLYQRLVVNNMSTRRNKFSITWSRDLVSDNQYVQFYEILRLQILDKVPSWLELMASRNVYGLLEGSDWYPEPSKMKEYEVIAFKVAQESCATSLTHDDINECMKDIIQEKSLIKPRLELSKEFHLHLLDSGYDMTELPLKYLSWRKNEDIPIITHWEISAYEKWFSQRHIRSMDKVTRRKELEKLHNEKAEQDTSNRFRYLTLKLDLAEKLGIISQIRGRTDKTPLTEFAVSP